MNKDPIENLYKDAFAKIKPVEPSAIMSQLEGKLDAKPTRFKRKTLVVLFAACFLLVSTAAVAAAQVITNRPGIAMLAEAIGEDEVRELQHIEIDNIPTAATSEREHMFILSDLVDAANDEHPEPPENIFLYWVDSIETVYDMRVELIAVGTGYEYMDMYLLLEDMVGNRFVHDDWISVSHYVRFAEASDAMANFMGHGHPMHMEIIGRDVDAGIVLLHSRLSRPQVRGSSAVTNPRNLVLNIMEIVHNFSYYGEQVLDVDLAALIAETSPLQIIGKRRPYISASSRELWNSMYILQPHALDYRFEIEGSPVYISAIGVIDGMLRIQTYSPGNGNFQIRYLQRPCGERVEEYGSFRFKLNEARDFVPSRGMVDGHSVSHGRMQYAEYIFDVDVDDLAGYSIVGHFRTSEEINLNWAVNFELVGGVDAAPPTFPPQFANQPNPPCPIEWSNSPYWAMTGEGSVTTVTIMFHDMIPRRSFTCVNGITTYEEDFDTLPALLEQYLWYMFWRQEFDIWE